MSRTNRRHNRAIERKRRNKGPELFSKAADDELQKEAGKLVSGLAKATIDHGSAAAASLLIDMAECADYPAVYQRALSLAEKWSKEPPFVPVEIVNERKALPGARPQLTDGSAASAKDDEVMEGEVVEAEEASTDVEQAARAAGAEAPGELSDRVVCQG